MTWGNNTQFIYSVHVILGQFAARPSQNVSGCGLSMWLCVTRSCCLANMYFCFKSFKNCTHVNTHIFQTFHKHWATFLKLYLPWKTRSTPVHIYQIQRTSIFLRTSVQLCPPFPQLHWFDKRRRCTHLRCAGLLRLNPTTTTTNLIRLERCKPFCHIILYILAVLLTIFQPFQICMNYTSSGKGVKIKNE